MTHITLWCLLSAPLLIGCDLTKLDDWTLALLTNDDVIGVNQDPLGKQAARLWRNDYGEIWAKKCADGSVAAGLFNLGPCPDTVTVDWNIIGLSGKRKVRDLWTRKDMGTFENSYSATVPSHGVVLVKIA